jgi:TatD-related deoxyribonuclease
MLPILDNHMHLDRRGRFIEAVRDFKKSGGTHIVLVSKPSWTLGVNITRAEDWREVFDETIRIAEEVRKTGVGVFVVLGVHPAEISRLCEHKSVEEALSLMKAGIEIAGRYVEEQVAVGLKSGRPHYPVPDEVWEASNQIIEHAMTLARELDCALQLHTESATTQTLEDLQAMAKKTGMPPYRVVKHYAPPMIKEFEETGIFPSVIASKAGEALVQGHRFLMETDYIDDLKRAGAVLGPRTVPRKTRKLVEAYGEEPFYWIHRENPEKVYGVEISL